MHEQVSSHSTKPFVRQLRSRCYNHKRQFGRHSEKYSPLQAQSAWTPYPCQSRQWSGHWLGHPGAWPGTAIVGATRVSGKEAPRDILWALASLYLSKSKELEVLWFLPGMDPSDLLEPLQIFSLREVNGHIWPVILALDAENDVRHMQPAESGSCIWLLVLFKNI